jgi:hypothetical protein
VLTVVEGFVFGWRQVASVLAQAAVDQPVDPLEGGDFDLVNGPPQALLLDQLGLVEPVDRLVQRVVVAVPGAPTEASIPASTSRSVNARDVYWLGDC